MVNCVSGKHKKGNRSCFPYRHNVVTGEIEALYHCKKCKEIMHFPLSKNPKEKEIYEMFLKETQSETGGKNAN